MFPWLAALGLLFLASRLIPLRKRRAALSVAPHSWPRVSLIVPARNEEARLGLLLDSLAALDYPDYEVLVLDDRSTDNTAQIARSYGGRIRLIEGQSKPEDWFGKPWACYQAAGEADGKYLLFTDADTVHRPQSLRLAIRRMLTRDADGFSAVPFHEAPSFWEKLLGPFQILLFALTAPYGKPRRGRVFAIGQYLIFEREFYEKIGGHRAIQAEAIDDLALAHLTLQQEGRWEVYAEKEGLYSVRMYESFGDFIRGWRRNFRGSFRFNTRWSVFEVIAIFLAWTAALSAQDGVSLGITALSLILMARVQKRLGNFSVLGVLLFPLSLVAFTLVTLLAVYDKLLARPLIWKSRSYTQSYLKTH